MSTAEKELSPEEVQAEIKAAELKLQAARMKRDGIETMSRSEWDAMTQAQRNVFVPKIRSRKLILVDEEI